MVKSGLLILASRLEVFHTKLRPAVIMQNDLLGIKDLNTAIVIPFTSNLDRADYEPNVLFKKE